jgi:hypothetical protein
MECFLFLFIPISNDSDIWSSFYEFEHKEVRHFLGESGCCSYFLLDDNL